MSNESQNDTTPKPEDTVPKPEEAAPKPEEPEETASNLKENTPKPEAAAPKTGETLDLTGEIKVHSDASPVISASDMKIYSDLAEKYKPQPPSDKITTALSSGGLLFLGGSLAMLLGLAYYLTYKFAPAPFPVDMNLDPSRQYVQMMNYYLAVYFTPLCLFIGALIAALIGYGLLRAAGTATKQTIPTQDYQLLAQMLLANNSVGIRNYVTLSGLTGLTGMFTKLNLSGLALSTIVLTIFFSILGLFFRGEANSLFDLAKLTLGAFIGSYVQKQSSDIQFVGEHRQDQVSGGNKLGGGTATVP